MVAFAWNAALVIGVFTTISRASVIEGRRASPAVETWRDWTCPLPLTVSLSFTEYVPVTTTEIQTATTSVYTTETISVYNVETTSIYETATTSIFETETSSIYTTEISYETIVQPTTVYQTIVSIITTIESTTNTDFVTVPTTTTSLLTLTATELEELITTTSKATSLIICPTRIANPTFTLAAPFPTDWTWGCPPGWLCKPKQEGCNFEAGLPDRGFYCAPNECVPAESLPAALPTWDDTIYGNDSAATNPALSVNAIDSFFNMNPTNFGLTYQIFIVDEVIVYTSTILLPPSPTVGARQAQTSVPSACYPWCNNCLLEAQSAGKSPKLCQPGSAFEVSYSQCAECISVHKTDNSDSFVQIAPQFQQFLDYCAQYSTAVTSILTTQTTVVGQSTVTTVQPITSVTIVPTSEASLFSTLLSTSISGTSVLTATIIPSSSPPPPSSSSPPASSASPSAASSVSSSSAALTSVAASTRASSSPASQHVYTTTSAILTTSTAPATTYSGTAVTSITIIVSSNGTAVTMSGSELSTYTVVIPLSTAVSSYQTTMTLTSSGHVTSSPPPAVPASSAATSASTSTFTGGAAPSFIPSLEQTLVSMFLGWIAVLM